MYLMYVVVQAPLLHVLKYEGWWVRAIPHQFHKVFVSVPELALLIHLLFHLLLLVIQMHKPAEDSNLRLHLFECFCPLLQHKSEFMNAMSSCSKNITDLSQNLYGHCGTSHITSVDTAKAPFANQ